MTADNLPDEGKVPMLERWYVNDNGASIVTMGAFFCASLDASGEDFFMTVKVMTYRSDSISCP